MYGRKPLVSVIVPHFNDVTNLRRCLTHVLHQSWPVNAYEVIVSDNNSQGGLAAIKSVVPPGVMVVHAREQGAGPARNAGVAAARGEIFAFIDSDCFAHPDWIREGLEALDRFDYVGGKVITIVEDTQNLTAAAAYEVVFAFNFKKYIEKDKFSGTGNLFVPRKIFQQIGGFRSGVSEDVDWCRRANAKQMRLGYAEKAVVEHPARSHWSDLTRKCDRVLIETFLLSQERPKWQLRWLGYTTAVAVSPFVHWVRPLLSPRLPGVHAKLMGIVGLIGIRYYRSYHMLRLLLWRNANRTC
jgi:glycosyltransferase involved in cell wall biosynthesis